MIATKPILAFKIQLRLKWHCLTHINRVQLTGGILKLMQRHSRKDFTVFWVLEWKWKYILVSIKVNFSKRIFFLFKNFKSNLKIDCENNRKTHSNVQNIRNNHSLMIYNHSNKCCWSNRLITITVHCVIVQLKEHF